MVVATIRVATMLNAIMLAHVEAYRCDLCDLVATMLNAIMLAHVEAYRCDLCDLVATMLNAIMLAAIMLVATIAV